MTGTDLTFEELSEPTANQRKAFELLEISIPLSVEVVPLRVELGVAVPLLVPARW